MVVVQRGPRQQGVSIGSNYTAVAVLILLNLLCFQLGRNYEGSYSPPSTSSLMALGSSSSSGSSVVNDPLRPQPGEAVNLPAIRTKDDEARSRKIYGGKGDGQHLGGW